MKKVNSDLFNVVQYSGHGDNRRIEFTDAGFKLAAFVAFKGNFKSLSGQGVKMLLECVNLGRFETSSKGYASTVVNELMEPWTRVNDAVSIYPEEYPQWESDAECFFDIDNPKMLAGNQIASTFRADIAAKLILNELGKLKARIRIQEGLSLVD